MVFLELKAINKSYFCLLLTYIKNIMLFKNLFIINKMFYFIYKKIAI